MRAIFKPGVREVVAAYLIVKGSSSLEAVRPTQAALDCWSECTCGTLNSRELHCARLQRQRPDATTVPTVQTSKVSSSGLQHPRLHP